MGKRKNKQKTSTYGSEGSGRVDSTKVDDKSIANQPLVSGGKRFIFSLILLCLPFFLLILLELALRWSGYGYPTSFILTYTHNGKEYFIENQYFGWRFFPKSMARTPEPFMVEAKKPSDTIRIVVFGESAALGDPHPPFGFSRVLEVLLSEVRPDIKFEVINVSMTAINSHVIAQIAKDCVKLNADYWLIYMGNNEVIGPFSPAGVYSPRLMPRFLIRPLIAFKSLRIYQLLDNILELVFARSKDVPQWLGMEMFLKNQIHYDDPRLRYVYRNFKDNLQRIIDLGHSTGAKVIVSTVVANYKNCAPFASLHRKNLANEELKRWESEFSEGVNAQKNGLFDKAISHFENAEKIDPCFAELKYRIAKCLEIYSPTNSKIAGYYLDALDYDTLRFRPDRTIINTIVEIAKSSQGKATLIVAHKKIADGSSDGTTERLPGRDLLWEHVHLNFEGNYRLAIFFAEEILKTLPGTNRVQGVLADSETVYKKLGLTDWVKQEIYQELQKRLELPPFTDRCDHKEEKNVIDTELIRLEQTVKTNNISTYIQQHRTAVEGRPSDWVLRKFLAEILEASGDYGSAIEQWSITTNLIPHYIEPYFKIANLLDEQGRSEEAKALFEKAISLKPYSPEAWSGYGLCLLNLGRSNEAINALKKALKINPKFPAALVNLAIVYGRLGNIPVAKEYCLEAIKVKTNYAPAYINLGRIYASKGDYNNAFTNYQMAVRSDPKNPIAYYNLGNACSRLNRPFDAITNYQTAIKLNPNFGEAYLNLALEQAKAGMIELAMGNFAESARIMTNNFEAQFNYAIACARTGNYLQAREVFKRCIELDPQNPQVYYNLGLVFLKLGEHNRAIEYFKQTLSLQPDHKEALLHVNQLMK